MRCALTRLVNHLLRVSVRFSNNFLIPLLGLRELFPDLLRVELTFFNFPTPIFKHGEDRLVGKAAQQERNDAKADHLREKELPIPAESLGRIANHIAKTLGSSRSGDDDIHKSNSRVKSVRQR